MCLFEKSNLFLASNSVVTAIGIKLHYLQALRSGKPTGVLVHSQVLIRYWLASCVESTLDNLRENPAATVYENLKLISFSHIRGKIHLL